MTRRTCPSPQMVAVRVLRGAQRPGAFSNRLLGEHLERHLDLSAGARGLVTSLVYGVLRQRNRLDAHLDARLRAPSKLGALPREILRIGAYEILELGRSAANAIDHTIETARAFDGAGHLAGLAHAVLAAVEAEAPALDAKLAAGPPLDALQWRWSLPRWLAGRWLRTLGPEGAVRRAQALLAAPPVDLRVDLTRIDAATARDRLLEERPGATIEVVKGQPQALRVRQGGDLFFGQLHDDGLVSVQGLAAQQPAVSLQPEPGMTVLDGCAGMGIKTLQLAELMRRRGCIVAADAEPRKVEEHQALAIRGRLQAPGLRLVSLVDDLTAPSVQVAALGPFDAALLDVPCTGLGNLARHPEIRWQRAFEDIAAAAELQRRLLGRCLGLVRPGSRLVYAVCSGEPEEGPQRVAEALGAGGLVLEDEQTLTPEHDGTEGFYLARLRVK